MAPAAATVTSGRSGVRGGSWYHAEVALAAARPPSAPGSLKLPITGVRAGSSPNGRNTREPFTPTGP